MDLMIVAQMDSLFYAAVSVIHQMPTNEEILSQPHDTTVDAGSTASLLQEWSPDEHDVGL